MTTANLLLLVEDERLILDYARDVLEDGGYGVVTVEDGHSAMELLNQRIGELSGVVTDIRLPGGPNGWEVARHARELRPDIPVVYMSGDSAGDWSAYGVPKSMILQKPYAAAQLMTAISVLLNDASTGTA